MTFIQPDKKNIWTRAFLILVVLGLIGGTFWLIALYNRTVTLNNKIADAKVELDAIGAENTSLNNQIVTMLGSAEALSAIAASDGLVVAKPRYVSVAQ